VIHLEGIRLTQSPFPNGVAFDVLDPTHFAQLCTRFPDERLFKHLGGAYNKFSLSEVNNPEAYKSFIKSDWVWYGLHFFIKSREFIARVGDALAKRGVKLPAGAYSSRFEFSSMPADGGFILPHTDVDRKAVTIVIGMAELGKLAAWGGWNKEWGGGTRILIPRDVAGELKSYEASEDAFNVVAEHPCVANGAVLFAKTKDSWHSVAPMHGPIGINRRSVTINIERAF
jgi:hypothetical protein